MTDERGHFLIPALPPGTYNVRAELQGFAPRTLDDVVLTLGSLIDVRLSLNVAGGQEIVLVAGDAPVIDPQKTVVSSVISQEQIQHLPINGRNFIGFSLLAPGVATDRTPQQGASGTSGLSFAGQRARSNNITVDGLDNNDSDHRQRARDVQPGGRARVPGAHQFVFGRVRQGIRRGRQHRDQERHEHDGGQPVLLPARRRAEFEGSLRALRSGRAGRSTARRLRTRRSSTARRSAVRSGGTARSISCRSSGSTSPRTTSSRLTTRTT